MPPMDNSVTFTPATRPRNIQFILPQTPFIVGDCPPPSPQLLKHEIYNLLSGLHFGSAEEYIESDPCRFRDHLFSLFQSLAQKWLATVWAKTIRPFV